MNERAVPQRLGPLWHVEGAHTFFAGPLDYNASHQHGAPVYLAGLYACFRLRFDDTGWITCRTAFIPAGVRHELDCEGQPLAVLYLEPEASPRALTGLLQGASCVATALVAPAGEIVPLRALYEDRGARAWAGEALADLAGFSRRQVDERLDGRIAHVVLRLGASRDASLSAETLARTVGLSSSRLQHLFTQEVGVPFRRYRGWVRMRQAIAAVAAGANLTGAAYEAGFADQAHFANDFRATFGAPASRSLLGVRR